MRQKLSRKPKGFTLVELMIVIAITGIFGASVLSVWSNTNKTRPSVTGNLQLQSTMLLGTNKLLRIVRSGLHFAAPRLNETSNVLVILDNKNNFQAIFPMEDKEYTKRYKKKMYKVVQYQVETASFNFISPPHDPNKYKTLFRNVASISFRLSCANSLTTTIRFQNYNYNFEVITESSLMNSGKL